jgi:hypothetical protein
LAHYDDPGFEAAGVTGAGGLIQSDFSDGDHGDFEVIAPIRNTAGGTNLWHYFRDNQDITTPWRQGQRVAVNVAGPSSPIQSDFSEGDHGNFEVVVAHRGHL